MNVILGVNREVTEDIEEVELLARLYADEFKKLESGQSKII